MTVHKGYECSEIFISTTANLRGGIHISAVSILQFNFNLVIEFMAVVKFIIWTFYINIVHLMISLKKLGKK